MCDDSKSTCLSTFGTNEMGSFSHKEVKKKESVNISQIVNSPEQSIDLMESPPNVIYGSPGHTEME